MNNSSIKDSMQNFALQQALRYVEGDPEENIPKLMALADKLLPKDWFEAQRGPIRQAIRDKNNWYQLILKLYDLDPGVRRTFFQSFIFNAALKGFAEENEVSEREGCNVPWAILLDPTSACNLRCTGCWAAEYGHQLNLSLEDLDSIVRQGKELGTYMYIYTGGEPLVRKADLIRLCEMHPDCEFLAFTNGTLIDAGALFAWFFHYMPVGNSAAVELLPDPDQREMVCRRIREYRSSKPIFTMDFQNDAEYVGGCIADGRRYLHINANGDVEPCVFVHYSNVNIHDCTLLEALKSPLFMAYHDAQPFNENMFQPCPMLENPQRIRAMVNASGAVNTDYMNREDVEDLVDKTTPYARNWAPKAEELWAERQKK